MSKTIVYELALPVFKKGDDLARNIKNAETSAAKNTEPLVEAFSTQADFYERAREMCNELAEVAMNYNIQVSADTHRIEVSGPEEVLEPLVEEGILTKLTYE